MAKTRDKREARDKKRRVGREVAGGAAGALAGGTIGAVAGPPGALAGAMVGAIAGAIAGRAIEEGDEVRASEDRELDREIGVSGGELGAPNLAHPPATLGTYSGGSAGVGPASSGEEPAEGPMPAPKS